MLHGGACRRELLHMLSRESAPGMPLMVKAREKYGLPIVAADDAKADFAGV